MTTCLDIEAVIEINRGLAEIFGLRDRGLLESALQQPMQVVYGTELYPTLAEKAAVLTRGISHGQVFLNGNKRTAWLSALTFMREQGMSTLVVPEAAAMVIDLSTGVIDVADFAFWLVDRVML